MSDLLLPHAPVPVGADGLAIGEAAQACGVTADTLRYYEKEDLLLEPTARDAAGRRRYTARDLAWISGLVMLRETGMPIAQLRRMAELYRTPGADAERLQLLVEHRDHVIAERQRTARYLEAIDAKIASYQTALLRPAR